MRWARRQTLQNSADTNQRDMWIQSVNGSLPVTQQIEAVLSSTLVTVAKLGGTQKLWKGSRRMTIGMIFYIIAAIIFFLAGTGSAALGPNPTIWGFFCIALGLTLDDFGFGAFRRR